LIIDCTADNDIAYLLDKLEQTKEVMVFSITNHANELVCVTKPNLYRWVTEIFKSLGTGSIDLYNPTGCWSPTFRASYNDIAVLIQFALKHINSCYSEGVTLRSFYVTSDFNKELNVKIKQL
jgi:hypothetical protein